MVFIVGKITTKYLPTKVRISTSFNIDPSGMNHGFLP